MDIELAARAENLRGQVPLQFAGGIAKLSAFVGNNMVLFAGGIAKLSVRCIAVKFLSVSLPKPPCNGRFTSETAGRRFQK
jgi:hypothetical protein